MGRPRSFDPDSALKAIKSAFWRLGYEGASMQDIEVATGLKKQSLYRQFGDKRQMYLQALNHYEQNEIRNAETILLAEGTARDRFERLFTYIVDDAIRTGDRSGCFLCNASVDQAQLDPHTLEYVEKMMAGFLDVFVKALTASDPYKSDSEKRKMKAAEVLTIYLGLRVLIKANMPEPVLRSAVREMISSLESE